MDSLIHRQARMASGAAISFLRPTPFVAPLKRSVIHVGSQAVVSWSSSVTGFTLQTNGNPAAGTWGNYAGQIVNNTITNSLPAGNLFFRLKQ